ncbi:MAG: hypothetical protein C0436_00575 [Alphaproteobacteria bacterium]|nr:hypothetical protein [Alphaproteobacteria bacterium]
MSETTIPFNTAPKVGDAFFIHFPANAFEEPEDMSAHKLLSDCEDSAKCWASENHKTMLVLECRVVRRVRAR